jgi:iron-sulfur cluster repair protein YtfE (RIC family)
MNEESGATPNDAINQLVADHQEVKGLFKQFEGMKDASDEAKGAIVEKISSELAVHEGVENDVFFPAVREVLQKKDVLEEAAVEQEDAGEAIQALSDLTPGEPGYDQKVKDLGARIASHAADEERDVFPQVQRSEIDTAQLGAEMAAHKAELKQEQGSAS